MRRAEIEARVVKETDTSISSLDDRVSMTNWKVIKNALEGEHIIQGTELPLAAGAPKSRKPSMLYTAAASSYADGW